MSDQYAELRCPKCGLYETDGAKSCCWEPADTVADGGSASKSDVEPDQHADTVVMLRCPRRGWFRRQHLWSPPLGRAVADAWWFACSRCGKTKVSRIDGSRDHDS